MAKLDGAWLSLKLEPKNSKDRTNKVASKAALLISVPKKIVGSAVRRNRIRRLIREVVRIEYQINFGFSYRFQVYQAPSEPDYQSVKNAIQKIWPS